MVDVLVSVLVVAIGLLGMASLQLTSVKTSVNNAGQSQGQVSGVSEVSICSSEQQAVFDVWDVFCNSAEDDVYVNSADMISLSKFSIDCVDSNAENELGVKTIAERTKNEDKQRV